MPLISLVGGMPLHVVLVGAPHQVPRGQAHLLLTLMAGLKVGVARWTLFRVRVRVRVIN